MPPRRLLRRKRSWQKCLGFGFHGFSGAVAYADRAQWAQGLHVAAVTLHPTVVGYAKQMLEDN